MKFKEDDLQMQVASYLDLLNVTWCHVANERKAKPQAGARLKRKGVKSGVPDCLIFDCCNGFNGLAIELKIKPNKPTVNQLGWLLSLEDIGWKTWTCYTFEDAKETIDEYLKQ